MEEAAGSEASFCLQSILPPPEYFPPPFPPPQYFLPPRLRRVAGGCGAPRGAAGSPPQGASGAGGLSPQRSYSPPCVLILPRRGDPGGCLGGSFFLGGGARVGQGEGPVQPCLWRWLLAGSRGRTLPAGDPRVAKLFHRVRGGGEAKKPPSSLLLFFVGYCPWRLKRGNMRRSVFFVCLFVPHLARQ